MVDQLKIRLKTGDREIEIEGSRTHVDELLQAWWTTGAAHGRSEPERNRRSSARSAKVHAPSANGTAAASTFDPQPIVNAMREDKRHDLWEKKVLHAKSAIMKIKLVCGYEKQFRTTGEITTILEGLGVKTSVSSVSHSVKDSLSDFIQDGARSKGAVVRYKLTGKAEKDFETWLNTDE